LVTEIHAEARAVVAARVTVGRADPHPHAVCAQFFFVLWQTQLPTTGQILILEKAGCCSFSSFGKLNCQQRGKYLF
jgi:hypothetical protein